MLRCLAFVVRGIGAIPALVRAFPKTCVTAYNDYAYALRDPDLLAFMQKHDVHNSKDRCYSFGRAVNEFRVTLQRLTRVKHGEDEIVFVFLEGSPRQQFLQRLLYQRCAQRWANWWELHWKEHVSDELYSRVNLPPLVEESLVVDGFPQGPEAKVTGRHAIHHLESVRNSKAEHVFLDLDTGRVSGLPKPLRARRGTARTARRHSRLGCA